MELNGGDTNGLIVVSVSAGILVLIFIFFLTGLSRPLGLLDAPDARKHHKSDVPVVGGLAIFFSVVFFVWWGAPSEKLFWLLVSATILVTLGAIDDIVGLGVRIRFFVQIFSTVLMMLGSGVWISSIGISSFGLDSINWIIAWPLTVFAVVGLTNGFNMVDGIDGLAAGHMLISLVCVVTSIHWTAGHVPHIEWLLILIMAVLAFGLVNLSLTPLKPVFLGDAGSLLLGFFLSWILIYFSQRPEGFLQPVTALWCVAVPIFDTVRVIFKRLRSGQSPFSPDRQHLHHILLDHGLGPRATLVVILAISLMLSLMGIFGTYFLGSSISLGLYLIFFLGFIYLAQNLYLKSNAGAAAKSL